MKTPTFSTLPQLEQLIDHIDFHDGVIRIKGGASIPFFSGNEQYPSDLPARLPTILYEHFYCTGRFTGFAESSGSSDSESSVPVAQKIKFIEKLQEAAAFEEGMDRRWKIEDRDAGGSLHVSKGQYRRIVQPGEYVDHQELLNPDNGSYVHLWKKGWTVAANSAFFFVYGRHLTDTYAPFLVRFYFHLVPQGASEIIRSISGRFDHYTIPFSFKCLNDPVLYRRADAGVLYLPKSYVRPAWEILEECYPEWSGYLRRETPLFTLPLRPGLGFAENPPLQNQSFGTSRCEIIASSLIQSYNDGVAKRLWGEALREAIKSKNLDSEKLYLNPGSHYPYPFKAVPYEYDHLSQTR